MKEQTLRRNDIEKEEHLDKKILREGDVWGLEGEELEGKDIERGEKWDRMILRGKDIKKGEY